MTTHRILLRRSPLFPVAPRRALLRLVAALRPSGLHLSRLDRADRARQDAERLRLWLRSGM